MTQAKKKRRYQPPAILSSDAFERLALSCSGTQQGLRKPGNFTCTTHGAS